MNSDIQPLSAACSCSIVVVIFISPPKILIGFVFLVAVCMVLSIVACTIQEKLSVFENEPALITALSVCLHNIAGVFIFI